MFHILWRFSVRVRFRMRTFVTGEELYCLKEYDTMNSKTITGRLMGMCAVIVIPLSMCNIMKTNNENTGKLMTYNELTKETSEVERIVKSDEEWRRVLTP